MGFAEGNFAVHRLRRVQHDEQRFAVGFDLGPLVRVVGVLDRQLVQAELLLQLAQQRFIGLMRTDPDEALRRIGKRIADGFQIDIAARTLAAVGDAVDQHRLRGIHAGMIAGLCAGHKPRRVPLRCATGALSAAASAAALAQRSQRIR